MKVFRFYLLGGDLVLVSVEFDLTVMLRDASYIVNITKNLT